MGQPQCKRCCHDEKKNEVDVHVPSYPPSTSSISPSQPQPKAGRSLTKALAEAEHLWPQDTAEEHVDDDPPDTPPPKPRLAGSFYLSQSLDQERQDDIAAGDKLETNSDEVVALDAEEEEPEPELSRRCYSRPKVEEPAVDSGTDPDTCSMLAMRSVKQSVEVMFNAGNDTPVTVSFLKRPLGMHFKFPFVRPLTVASVVPGGHAEQLGVRAAWQFEMITGIRVADMGYERVTNFLREECSVLPGSVDVEFLVNGTAVVKSFVTLPLGMDFSDTVPVEVSTITPGGHAQQLGVGAGGYAWKFNKIFGKSVAHMECTQLSSYLNQQLASLSQDKQCLSSAIKQIAALSPRGQPESMSQSLSQEYRERCRRND